MRRVLRHLPGFKLFPFREGVLTRPQTVREVHDRGQEHHQHVAWTAQGTQPRQKAVEQTTEAILPFQFGALYLSLYHNELLT